MRAAFYTLGCKVNQYETQVLEQYFSAQGYEIVDPSSEADVYIINSCTVTAAGDKKSRQALRRFRRQNPSAMTVLTGCFPQAFPDAAARIPEADVITGSRDRAGLLAAVREFQAAGERVVRIVPHAKGEAFEPMQTGTFRERTRAFVKIEDGCDRYCTYCIIPKARGPVRSKPLPELKSELEGLAGKGYLEVVLVGINLPSYGREMGLRLIDAIELACSIPGIQRVRLGSLEPELLTKDDISRMSRQPKLCPQFHLSLQSGCDETLKRMNRHYDTAGYRRIVSALREVFPGCAVTTDLMVGFPGETEAEFQASAAFAKEIGFAKTHVFAYSPREGTRAAAMDGQIPSKEKERRSAYMMGAAEASRQRFLEGQIGRTEHVLLETPVDQDFIQGYTAHYIPVRIRRAPGAECGNMVPVKILGVTGSGEGSVCTGEYNNRINHSEI